MKYYLNLELHSEFTTVRDRDILFSLFLNSGLNISETKVSKIESGKWNFGIDTITIFAIYLDFKITL